MREAAVSEAHPETTAKLLFKHKEGPVNVEVWGPTEGFHWRKVDYFCWAKSTKEPDGWLKVRTFRENDQPQLERCVKHVRTWFKQHQPYR